MSSETIGELGTSAPSAATWTEVYAVPNVAGNYAVTSLFTVCNNGASTDYFSIATVTHGAGNPTTQEYKTYLVPVDPNCTYLLNIALTLAQNKAISVYSQNGTLAFSAQGVQNV